MLVLLRFLRLLPVFCLMSCGTPGLESRNAIAKARQYGLIDVSAAIPDISVNLRYITRHNVAGHPVYPRSMPCLLFAPTVERLKQAQAALRLQGYGLRIWDAWRPPEAQQVLYSHGGRTGMFLDPGAGWSRHCGGVSVDATLVDLEGHEQRLPTYFDEDLEKASSVALPHDPVILRNLKILHQAMREAGLIPLPGEWWHFDDKDFIHDPVPVITAAKLGIKIR